MTRSYFFARVPDRGRSALTRLLIGAVVCGMVLFPSVATGQASSRANTQWLVDTARAVLVAGVNLGLDEAGTRLLGPTAWKGFKQVLSPVVERLKQRFPALSFGRPNDKGAADAGFDAAAYLAQDAELQKLLVASYQSLAEGQSEILVAVHRLESLQKSNSEDIHKILQIVTKMGKEEQTTPATVQRRSGLSGGTAEQHLYVGYSFGYGGDWDGAIAEYGEAIRLNPDYAEAHQALGVAFGWKGDIDGEIREEGEAVRLKPEYAEAHCELGKAFGLKGDWYGDMREERAALRLNADYAEAHQALGLAIGEMGDRDGEIREEGEAIRLKPYLVEAHCELGKALGFKGDWDGDMREQRTALQLDADNADAHESLGVVFEAKGNRQAAFDEYRRAWALKPNSTEYRGRYERLARQLGQQ